MIEGVVREELNKEKLIDILTEELPALRARIGITQEALCNIIGISRPTYNAIESQKKRMSWNVYLSLLLFFTQNEKTVDIIDLIGAFPDELKSALNVQNR